MQWELNNTSLHYKSTHIRKPNSHMLAFISDQPQLTKCLPCSSILQDKTQNMFLPVEHRSCNRFQAPQPPITQKRSVQVKSPLKSSVPLFFPFFCFFDPQNGLSDPKTWEKSSNNIEMRPNLTYLNNFFWGTYIASNAIFCTATASKGL